MRYYTYGIGVGPAETAQRNCTAKPKYESWSYWWRKSLRYKYTEKTIPPRWGRSAPEDAASWARGRRANYYQNRPNEQSQRASKPNQESVARQPCGQFRMRNWIQRNFPCIAWSLWPFINSKPFVCMACEIRAKMGVSCEICAKNAYIGECGPSIVRPQY